MKPVGFFRPAVNTIFCCFLLCIPAIPAFPSSHRDAPLISLDPTADNTDFYAFRSYEPGRETFVTLIANFIPFQAPEGGPVFYNMNPEARYRIHIDNNGDAVEDKTFEFTFNTVLRDLQVPIGGQQVSIPILNPGQVSPFSSNLSLEQTYRIGLINGPIDEISRTTLFLTNAADGSQVFRKPVDNIGKKTFLDYETYSQSFIYSVVLPKEGGTGRAFVGQRDDGFYIDLGGIFDLANIPNLIGAPNQTQDDLEGKSVTSIAIEIPIQFLIREGNPVIGVWSSVARPVVGNGPDTNSDGVVNARDILNVAGSYLGPISSTLRYKQVSRLGNPLVNEAIIGMKDKDRWNASHPKDDAQYLQYFTNPVLPFHFAFLASRQAPTLVPREDLIEWYLQGIPKLNATPEGPLADMLRLNTSISPTPLESQNPLGFLAGDSAGWPNGRRPGDDVVDITLRVGMGARLPQNQAPDGQLSWTDGVREDATDYSVFLPYLLAPRGGQE